MNFYVEKIITPSLCDYRNGFFTQQALVILNENWKTSFDKKRYKGVTLMDLLKAFDIINCEFFLMKPKAYGFSRYAHRINHHFVSNRQ